MVDLHPGSLADARHYSIGHPNKNPQLLVDGQGTHWLLFERQRLSFIARSEDGRRCDEFVALPSPVRAFCSDGDGGLILAHTTIKHHVPLFWKVSREALSRGSGIYLYRLGPDLTPRDIPRGPARRSQRPGRGGLRPLRRVPVGLSRTADGKFLLICTVKGHASRRDALVLLASEDLQTWREYGPGAGRWIDGLARRDRSDVVLGDATMAVVFMGPDPLRWDVRGSNHPNFRKIPLRPLLSGTRDGVVPGTENLHRLLHQPDFKRFESPTPLLSGCPMPNGDYLMAFTARWSASLAERPPADLKLSLARVQGGIPVLDKNVLESPKEQYHPWLLRDDDAPHRLVFATGSEGDARVALWLSSSPDGRVWAEPQKLDVGLEDMPARNPLDTSPMSRLSWPSLFKDHQRLYHLAFWTSGRYWLTTSGDLTNWTAPTILCGSANQQGGPVRFAETPAGALLVAFGAAGNALAEDRGYGPRIVAGQVNRDCVATAGNTSLPPLVEGKVSELGGLKPRDLVGLHLLEDGRLVLAGSQWVTVGTNGGEWQTYDYPHTAIARPGWSLIERERLLLVELQGYRGRLQAGYVPLDRLFQKHNLTERPPKVKNR